MKTPLALLAASCLASSALAQTGSYEWQVSTDGATWSNIAPFTPGTTYHVRLLAGWSGISGTDVGFAGGQFDGVINGNTAASTVSNIQRPGSFAFAFQTLVATSFGGVVKIDNITDTQPPGQGPGWVNPGQAAKDFAAPGTYNSNNPCVVLTYDIMPDDGVLISMLLNQTTGRAMAIYTNSGGTQARVSATAITVTNASIVIPAPGSLSLVGLSGLMAARRRR